MRETRLVRGWEDYENQAFGHETGALTPRAAVVFRLNEMLLHFSVFYLVRSVRLCFLLFSG